jgi:starvation-inducible outer membrane lipoprotein
MKIMKVLLLVSIVISLGACASMPEDCKTADTSKNPSLQAMCHPELNTSEHSRL